MWYLPTLHTTHNSTRASRVCPCPTSVRIPLRSGESTRCATSVTDAHLPTHPPTRALRNNHPPLERRTHPDQTFCRCSAKRLPLLSCCRLSCLLSTGGDITFLPKRDQSAAERAARGMHRALCAWARARGLAAASYAIVLPLCPGRCVRSQRCMQLHGRRSLPSARQLARSAALA